MAENEKGSGDKIDRLVEAEPMVVGKFSVQPVAHVTGKMGSGGDESGGGGGGAVRIRPTEVRVSEGGEVNSIMIDDPDAGALKGILAVAVAVAVACIAIQLVARKFVG